MYSSHAPRRRKGFVSRFFLEIPHFTTFGGSVWETVVNGDGWNREEVWDGTFSSSFYLFQQSKASNVGCVGLFEAMPRVW